MVNETIAGNARVLDFHLESTKFQNKSENLNVQRSASGVGIVSKEIFLKTEEIEEDPFAVSFDALLLPRSAENLSWKFFEQVSSLDNQLRSDEQSSVVRVNGCQVMSTSPKNTNPIENVNLNGHIDVNNLSKSNGFMPGATKKLSSQTQAAVAAQSQSPDLILQQQQQQTARHATFQFTSPTATFKRKKQQQQQLLHQQQQTTNNNNNQLQTPYEHHHQQHQQQPQNCKINILKLSPKRQQNAANHKTKADININITDADNNDDENVDDNHYDVDDVDNYDFNEVGTTAMISGAGSIIINTTDNNINKTAATNTKTGISTGTGSAHSFKTRTLPTISVVRGAYAAVEEESTRAADDVIIGKGTFKQSKNYRSKANNNYNNNNSNRQRRKQHKMGATLQHSADSFVDGIEQHFSLIGWRKKCLYTLLVLLMLLVVINMVLTLWIMRVMEFSTDGMGLLKIMPGGLQLTGQAIIMDTLRASTIRSRHGQPIAIESSRNFSINTRDTNGMLENHLFLGHDKLECLTTGFHINDTAGRNLFSVNRNEVTIGAHALRIDGEGGAIFRESIQTPHVRAEPGRELRLESPTRQLEMTAARDINLQSRAGGIELSALEDVKLSTLDGSLRLESTKILMPNLRTAQAPIPGTAQSREHLHRVFQLCACSNGKLFLAAPHSICAGDDSTVCR